MEPVAEKTGATEVWCVRGYLPSVEIRRAKVVKETAKQFVIGGAGMMGESTVPKAAMRTDYTGSVHLTEAEAVVTAHQKLKSYAERMAASAAAAQRGLDAFASRYADELAAATAAPAQREGDGDGTTATGDPGAGRRVGG